MRRRRDRIGKRRRYVRRRWVGTLLGLGLCGALGAGVYALWSSADQPKQADTQPSPSTAVVKPSEKGVPTARLMAHGDLLYHDALYMSAQQEDGSYDFSENFTYVKPWIEQADLAIADYEGTISPEYPLAGYPLFNAPASVAKAIADAGYDVVDLAHNHILDSHLSGLISTTQAFKEVGVDSLGVYPEGNRQTAPLLIKEVNGIKIALLAYAYGFNGMEGGLTQEEYDAYLSDMNLEKMKAEIERAEAEADVTVIMPQMGVEYQLEPTEIVEKDGERKLIVYSMGNFISNQRMETMEGVNNYQWTERGVLVDVTFEKKDGKTTIQAAAVHPSWVSRVENGRYAPDGGPYYRYQTYILEDFIEGGKHRDLLDEATKARVDAAYQETNDLMDLEW